MQQQFLFQYCQKIVLFNQAMEAVLLAKRKGEADYDGTYSFIGGKMETTDGGLLQGLQREKNEEIGAKAKIRICPEASCYNAYFVKKDGSAMVLPHYIAIFQAGDIVLSDEYSDYQWVKLSELDAFEPKIENIGTAVQWAKILQPTLPDDSFVEI